MSNHDHHDEEVEAPILGPEPEPVPATLTWNETTQTGISSIGTLLPESYHGQTLYPTLSNENEKEDEIVTKIMDQTKKHSAESDDKSKLDTKAKEASADNDIIMKDLKEGKGGVAREFAKHRKPESDSPKEQQQQQQQQQIDDVNLIEKQRREIRSCAVPSTTNVPSGKGTATNLNTVGGGATTTNNSIDGDQNIPVVGVGIREQEELPTGTTSARSNGSATIVTTTNNNSTSGDQNIPVIMIGGGVDIGVEPLPLLRATGATETTNSAIAGAYAIPGLGGNVGISVGQRQLPGTITEQISGTITESTQEQTIQMTQPPRSTDSGGNTTTSNDTIDNHNNNEGLVEARPVSEQEEDEHTSVLLDMMEEAQPVHNHEEAARRKSIHSMDQKYKRVGCGFVVLAVIVVGVALSLGLGLFGGNGNSNNEVTDSETSTTASFTIPPPMENLELLYNDLPETTKESLYSRLSPQYAAWEWLLNHPNISTLEEWRKKQIFAMGSFFYSMEGPKWPAKLRNRWMDVNSSECSWILTDDEVVHFTQRSVEFIGPDAFSQIDIQPCKEDGVLQTIILEQLYFPKKDDMINPTIPPEIAMLSSLKIFVIMLSQTRMKLSDFSVPALIQHPSLLHLNVQSGGVSGTISEEFGQMSRLRHLLIGGNKLTGTIPTTIGNMASLEYFMLNRLPEGDRVNGRIPSELGLLSSLTLLDISSTSITGSLPSELGNLGRTLVHFTVPDNFLSGSIPSQIGRHTSCTYLGLWDNALGC